MSGARRFTSIPTVHSRSLLLIAALALAMPGLFLGAPTSAGAKPSHKPAAKPTPAQAKQIAKLEALTATLATELAGLEARSAALAAKAATVPTVPPSVLPFQGPAGGSLTGAYPGPRLAPGTVGTTALTGGSVTSAAVRDGSLTGADIQDGSLVPPLIPAHQVSRSIIPPGAGDAPNLGSVFEYPGPGNTEGERTIFPGEFSVVIKLSCPAGTTLLTGGWEWSDENGDGTTMFESHPAENSPETGTSFANTTWEWRPKVRPNLGTENTFKPKLLCLLD
jgi:hypothetical protein